MAGRPFDSLRGHSPHNDGLGYSYRQHIQGGNNEKIYLTGHHCVLSFVHIIR